MSVDRKYDVEINGQGFTLHNARGNYKLSYEEAYVPPNALATVAGETSASNFWWTKRHSDFSGGYDQLYTEAKRSQINRYLDSQDIDNSTPGKIRLHESMTSSLAKTGTNGYLHTALGNLILVDGTDIYYYNGTSWSAAKATGADTAIKSIADNGSVVFVAGYSKIRSCNASDLDTWSTDWATGTGASPTAMAFINKQLYGVQGSKFYKLVTGASQSTVVFDAGTGWTLDSIAEYNGKVVFSGHRGSVGDEKSYVWESDGTAAKTSVLIDDLPKGFHSYGELSYSDVLWIWGGWELTTGTAAMGGVYTYSNGALKLGGRFKQTAARGVTRPTAAATVDTVPRTAFAHDKFIYFGMNERKGLWRYDLTEGGLSPCWSAATTNGLVTGAAWYLNKIYLAYSGGGAFVQTTTFPSIGWIKTSATTMGHANKKLGRKVVLSGNLDNPPPTDNLDGATLPASDGWTKSSTQAGGTETIITTDVAEGSVIKTTGTGASDQWYFVTDATLDNAVGTYAEIRQKVITGATTTQQNFLAIDDGTALIYLDIRADRLMTYGQVGTNVETYLMETTDAYHTYGLYLKGSTVYVYVDGALRFSSSNTHVSSTAGVVFGDIASSSSAHEERWSFVRYWAATDLPAIVEVSSDEGTTFIPLANTYYGTTLSENRKEFDLQSFPLWDSLIVKATIKDSNTVINDISIEAVPTIPDARVWDLTLDLYKEIDQISGESEYIDPQKVWETLETAKTSRLPITYKDIDYDEQATKATYSVLLEKISRENVYIDEETVEQIIRVRLRQF